MPTNRTTRPARVSRTCLHCGGVFTAKPSTLKRGVNAGQCCSAACRYALATGRWAPFEDRFWAKVRKTDCCWLWTGSKTGGHSYGNIGTGGKHGKQIKAHRASWEIHNGPILDSLHVLHNCPGGDNPSCVNPAHLWLGDHDTNMKDMWRKLRAGLIHRCCHDAA